IADAHQAERASWGLADWRISTGERAGGKKRSGDTVAVHTGNRRIINGDVDGASLLLLLDFSQSLEHEISPLRRVPFQLEGCRRRARARGGAHGLPRVLRHHGT